MYGGPDILQWGRGRGQAGLRQEGGGGIPWALWQVGKSTGAFPAYRATPSVGASLGRLQIVFQAHSTKVLAVVPATFILSPST